MSSLSFATIGCLRLYIVINGHTSTRVDKVVKSGLGITWLILTVIFSLLSIYEDHGKSKACIPLLLNSTVITKVISLVLTLIILVCVTILQFIAYSMIYLLYVSSKKHVSSISEQIMHAEKDKTRILVCNLITTMIPYSVTSITLVALQLIFILTESLTFRYLEISTMVVIPLCALFNPFVYTFSTRGFRRFISCEQIKTETYFSCG